MFRDLKHVAGLGQKWNYVSYAYNKVTSVIMQTFICLPHLLSDQTALKANDHACIQSVDKYLKTFRRLPRMFAFLSGCMMSRVLCKSSKQTQYVWRYTVPLSRIQYTIMRVLFVYLFVVFNISMVGVARRWASFSLLRMEPGVNYILSFRLWSVLQMSWHYTPDLPACCADGNGVEPIVPASESLILVLFYLLLAPVRRTPSSVNVNTQSL